MPSNTTQYSGNRTGFTLIEVSLAVLVLGLGLMVAFGLFPAGVRQNEESTADTRAALFADYVLNGMQANAATITNWSDWTAEASNFQDILGGAGMPVLNADLAAVQNTAPLAGVSITWPSSSTQKLRYRLTMGGAVGTRVYTATLLVKDLDDGSAFDPADGVFYTEFIFKGM